MIHFDETISQLAWTQLWQVTLVVLAAGLVARLACRRRPHLAYLVWLVVLAKCLTPPLWSSPTSLFSWTVAARGAAVQADRIEAPPSDTAAPGEAPLAAESHGKPIEPWRAVPGGTETPAGSVAANAMAAAGAPPNPAAEAMPLTLTRVLIALWLIGAIAQAAVALAAVIRWGRTIRRERIPPDGQLAALNDELARRLGIGRKVRLIATRLPLGPVTDGWLRPTIVLPEALVAARSAGELEPLLAHELIHVRRGDTLVGYLQMLVQALWWFHPLVRWANRQLALERERSCDEEVIAALDLPAARYVAGLLGVLELKLSLRIPLSLPGVRRSEITRQRLEHLLSHAESFQRRTPRRYWLLVVAAVLLLLPGAGLSGSAEPEVKKPQAAGQASEAAAENDAPKAAAAAAEPSAAPQPKPAIHVSNVVGLGAGQGGSATLRFTIAEPAGTHFQVVYRQWGVRGSVNASHILTIDAESADVELTFGYRPQFSGNRNVYPLHSGKEELTCQIDATGVTQPSLTTIASAPLWNVAAEDRDFTVIRHDQDAWAATKMGGRRVLLVCRKDQAGQDPEALKPRAEIVVYPVETQTQPSAASLRARLANTWSRQKYEIGSAQVQYHRVCVSDFSLAPLSRDEVNKILAAADLAKHPENYAAAASKLFLPEKLKETEFKPAARRFFSAGLNWRDEGERGVAVCDGESELRYDGLNHQMDVYAMGASHVGHASTRDFRIFFDLAPPSLFQIETLPDGRARLTNTTGDEHTEWILDAENGFVERVSGDLPRGGFIDRFQYGPVRYPGGIVMPTLKIESRYEDGALSYLDIWKIDQAQFNDGLPPGIFQMAAQSGTKVYIHGSDPTKPPKHVTIQKPTADLAQFLRGRPDLMPEWLINWPNDSR